MLTDHFPALGLAVTTPRLRLRLPDAGQLADLAELAAEGIHEADRMPFTAGWTDVPPAERARSVVQHHWVTLGTATPDGPSLPFAVLLSGRPVGMQSLDGRDFAVRREVASGSWLGRRYQRQGIGTEMRAAVLHLAFAGLGARHAVSGAFADNPASRTVSERLGYAPDGIEQRLVRGRPTVLHRFRLTRDDWARYRTVPVTIEGLDPYLAYLGG